MAIVHRRAERPVTDGRHGAARLTVGRSAPRRLAAVLAAGLVLLGLAHVVGTMVVGGISAVDLGAEQSVGTWVNSELHALNAVLAATAALLARGRRSRWEKNWWLLSAVFALMSWDEVAAVHDRLLEPVRDALDATGVFYYAWVIPALVLGAVFLAVQVQFLRALDGATRRGLMLAGVLFVAGAAGFEMAEGWLASTGRRESAVFDWLILVEELLEMGALMLAACVLLRYVVETFGELQLVFGGTPTAQADADAGRVGR